MYKPKLHIPHLRQSPPPCWLATCLYTKLVALSPCNACDPPSFTLLKGKLKVVHHVNMILYTVSIESTKEKVISLNCGNWGICDPVEHIN